MDGRRWTREPLVWFVAVGALIFAVDRALAGGEGAVEAIVIDDAFVAGLRARHLERHGRAPDAREEEALVRDFAREEALYREARAAGLDEGDGIVRRRMVQKLEMLLGGSAPVEAPDDAALEAWVIAHEDELRAPARLTLEHRLFARDRRGDRAAQDARDALASAVQAGEAPVGDPFVRGTTIGPASEAQIAAELGPEFAREVIALEADGAWRGPIASTYGAHLVRVSARSEARVPPRGEVRARASAAWMEARRAAWVEAEIARIVARYPVVLE